MESQKREEVDAPLTEVIRRLKNACQVETSSRYLVEQFRPRLLSYFRHHKFSADDAEDLVQETFRRAFNGIGSLKDEARFLGWLFQIARNLRLTASSSVDPLLRNGSGDLWQTQSSMVVDASPGPLETTIQSEQLQRTWEAIERLPPQQKHCLHLRAVHEMSYEEIATVLRLSARTVRNHLREARLNLRRILGEV